LDVVLIDGFAPSQGDAFHLFDGSIVGVFDQVNLPTLDGGREWDVSRLYSAGTIGVVPEPGTFALLAGLLVSASLIWCRRRAGGNKGVTFSS
jgi:hypothetical protein